MVIEQIRQVAIEKGCNEDSIKIFEGDCWHHLEMYGLVLLLNN